MISVIMCSRNDDYGYKLRERTVFSLNCWADELSLFDEIIYIDDNTEGGKPTLLEEIAQFLTPRTKHLIRGFKITPEVHEKFEVSIPVAENHCRNIGIRKARNAWIISTTNDNIPHGIYPAILEYSYAGYVGMPQRVPLQEWGAFVSYRHLRSFLHFRSGTFPLSQGFAEDDPKRWLIHRKGGDMFIGPTELFNNVRGFEEGMKDFAHGESNVLRKMMAGAYAIRSCANIGLFHLEHAYSEENPGSHFLDETKLNDFDYWCTRFWKTQNDGSWGMWPCEEIKL